MKTLGSFLLLTLVSAPAFAGSNDCPANGKVAITCVLSPGASGNPDVIGVVKGLRLNVCEMKQGPYFMAILNRKTKKMLASFVVTENDWYGGSIYSGDTGTDDSGRKSDGAMKWDLAVRKKSSTGPRISKLSLTPLSGSHGPRAWVAMDCVGDTE